MTKFVMARGDTGCIEVMQIGRETHDEIAKWTGVGTIDHIASHHGGLQASIHLSTPRGKLTALPGDYILKYGAMLAIVPPSAFDGLFVEVDEAEIASMRERAGLKTAAPDDINTGVTNAVEEGQQPGNDQQQHQDGDVGGQASEAGSGDSHEQGGQESTKAE